MIVKKDNPMTEMQNDQIIECERDGFPVLNINGEPHCLAEFVNFCIGSQKITDVVQRNGSLYYVFENRHELPLLCYCCGQPLECHDLQSVKRHVRGRTLQAMTWKLEELEDGRTVIDYQLEFSSKYGETEPLMVQTSTLSADKMVHPILCAHSGISIPNTELRTVGALPASNKKRGRR
jgi:hypothetical protein